jgi:hypothetical protein
LNQLQAHQPIVDLLKAGPENLIMSTSILSVVRLSTSEAINVSDLVETKRS